MFIVLFNYDIISVDKIDIFLLSEHMAVQTTILSSLSKVFLDRITGVIPENNVMTALKNETVSFQVAYLSDEDVDAKIKVSSDYPENVRIRTVEMVPVDFVARQTDYESDGHYLCTEPGLYPDILRDIDTLPPPIEEGDSSSWFIDHCQIFTSGLT